MLPLNVLTTGCMLRHRCSNGESYSIEQVSWSSAIVGDGKKFSVQLVGVLGLRLRRLDPAKAIEHFADPLGTALLQLLVGQLRGVEPDRRVQAQQASLSFADLHAQGPAGGILRFHCSPVKGAVQLADPLQFDRQPAGSIVRTKTFEP